MRVAGLLHVAEHVQDLPENKPSIGQIPKQIQAETFNKAQKLARYFIEHAKAAYGCMGADQGNQDAKYLLDVIKRQDKPVIEYRDIQNLTRKRFKKAVHLKTTLLELEERGFVHRKKDGRKSFLEVNPYLMDTRKRAHNTHNSPQILLKRKKQRVDDESLSVHNTHNSSSGKPNVGNVYQCVPEASTLQNQDRQEIKLNVGNVGENQGLENKDNEDLII
ncbi:DUF3987 domain-containing protein [Peribacillus cavernae]|uniref:DUF3987 domain-containing protein n=1 Tax=Peribacillus cavernae TaxID=1674310 RepID=UPI002482BFF3|nr:DUF3987 domain-containing protein [Peribacillus cavernae]